MHLDLGKRQRRGNENQNEPELEDGALPSGPNKPNLGNVSGVLWGGATEGRAGSRLEKADMSC